MGRERRGYFLHQAYASSLSHVSPPTGAKEMMHMPSAWYTCCREKKGGGGGSWVLRLKKFYSGTMFSHLIEWSTIHKQRTKMSQNYLLLCNIYSQLFQLFQAFDQFLFHDSDVKNILHHQIVLLIRHPSKDFMEGKTINEAEW